MQEAAFSQIEQLFPLNSAKKRALLDYVNLLLKWNQKINLIGRATEADIWQRHIVDSAQLVQYVPKNTQTLTDFGSGAGLPALVLAILAEENHIKQVRAIESVGKKASFMQEAVRLTGARVVVYNQRIEAISPWKSDVITARAFAPLGSLFSYILPFIYQEGEKDTLCILPKGCNIHKEIEEASMKWEFSYQLKPSMVGDNEGNIMIVEKVTKKNG